MVVWMKAEARSEDEVEAREHIASMAAHFRGLGFTVSEPKQTTQNALRGKGRVHVFAIEAEFKK